MVERRDAGVRLAAERVGGELAEGRRHGHGGRVHLLPGFATSTREFGR